MPSFRPLRSLFALLCLTGSIALLAGGVTPLGAQTLPGMPAPGTGSDAGPDGTDAETSPQGAPLDAEEPVPPEHRTPRATMMSFLGAFYVEDGIRQAVDALDLTDVPEAIRSVKGPELAVQLKEVLDRTRRIEPEEIPDDPSAPPYVFLTHETGQVVIGRQPDGEWLFTRATVATIPELFRALEGEKVVEGVRPASHALSPGLWLRSKMPRSLLEAVFLLEIWQWLGPPLAQAPHRAGRR